jgi:hypothetical protein
MLKSPVREVKTYRFYSRDTLAAISSIPGDDRLHTSEDLENTLTPPREPVNTPHQVTRVGLPNKEGEVSLISNK